MFVYLTSNAILRLRGCLVSYKVDGESEDGQLTGDLVNRALPQQRHLH